MDLKCYVPGDNHLAVLARLNLRPRNAKGVRINEARPIHLSKSCETDEGQIAAPTSSLIHFIFSLHVHHIVMAWS